MGSTDDTLQCNIKIVLNSQVMQRFEWPIVNNEETAMIISPRVKEFRAGYRERRIRFADKFDR
jgi:hypothetical protein